MKKKYIFFGEIESINLEIILKTFNFLKNKVNYIIIGNFYEITKQAHKFNYQIKINMINDPFDFEKLDKNQLSIFHVSNKNSKVQELIDQIKICNFFSNNTLIDLVTMPVNKALFKKEFNFNGLTEYFGILNNCETLMLMVGENFSIIPITTHINPNKINSNFKNKINIFFEQLFQINKKSKILNKYKSIKFICYNPHCGENDLLGPEDKIFKLVAKKYFKNSINMLPGDSAFKIYNKKTLFISTYHDQALIPFKILNKKSFNYTIGLRFKRLSPAHGIAKDIIFKNKADNNSYIECMLS